KDRIFCSGANIYMLGSSSHAFKVNFCKFTNETRLYLEDASAESGIKSIAALNGVAAGGGYELALACDEIYLQEDGNSAVSLPECPLLAVLPGTGGLTRLVDKRKVRRDHADVFSTVAEGIKGKRAQEWRLVDGVEPFLASELTRGPVIHLLLILAIATLLFGNLAAIPQTNFKRLLAYSSIAHAGFLLLALAAGAPETAASLGSVKVVSFYLATYLIMTLGVFFVLAQVRIQRDGENITDFNGLGKTNPLLALSLTILLAALAGVPLTAGFLGKFFVFSLAVQAHLWLGVGVAFIAAAAGFYYYFSVIRAMWWNNSGELNPVSLPIISKTCIALLTLATLVFGIWPQPILSLLN
ncbi:MAG: hypothetical protein H8M99_03895, partial [Gloeobacteraceae cyanobacterium ES-bin-144]|nr:hypothetical protein [Verrucomicrobiales bacterium]